MTKNSKSEALLNREILVERLAKDGHIKVMLINNDGGAEGIWAVQDPNNPGYVYAANRPLSWGCWGCKIKVKNDKGYFTATFEMQDESCRSDFYDLHPPPQAD